MSGFRVGVDIGGTFTDIVILGPEGELFNQAQGQGYKVMVVDKLRRAINPFNDIVSYFQIKKLLKQLQRT